MYTQTTNKYMYVCVHRREQDNALRRRMLTSLLVWFPQMMSMEQTSAKMHLVGRRQWPRAGIFLKHWYTQSHIFQLISRLVLIFKLLFFLNTAVGIIFLSPHGRKERQGRKGEREGRKEIKKERKQEAKKERKRKKGGKKREKESHPAVSTEQLREGADGGRQANFQPWASLGTSAGRGLGHWTGTHRAAAQQVVGPPGATENLGLPLVSVLLLTLCNVHRGWQWVWYLYTVETVMSAFSFLRDPIHMGK